MTFPTLISPRLALAPVTTLKGVGPHIAAKLRRLGIRYVSDLLFHLPLKYQDRTRVMAMGALRPGNEAVIQGRVVLSEIQRRGRSALLVRLNDGTGTITLRFFHFSTKQQTDMERGRWLRCYGEVRPGPVTLEMVHPEYRVVMADMPAVGEEHLTPVYPGTDGLHPATFRAIVAQALQRLVDEDGLEEYLPRETRISMRWPTLAEALRYVHRPPGNASVDLLSEGRHPAQQRLAFEELLAQHLGLRRLRAGVQRHRAFEIHAPGALFAALRDRLPFQLTAAQNRVIGEVCADLSYAHPMQRLVQGDVGSGKTLVAAAAVLRAVEAGHQAAVMAPTELLAEQHLRSFNAWLAPLGVEVGWLSGKLTGKGREKLRRRLVEGDLKVVVGTHALLQQDVHFQTLGLVVIDEQHRFGVHQRLALWERGHHSGYYPHQLIMTATPIPRTLTMVAYADLDCSVIDELPPGRKKVETVVVSDRRRAEVVARIRAVCAAGRQVYWVCTLIEESELLQCQAAQDTVVRLAEMLPGLRVGLLHGRLKASEKENVMEAFKTGAIDILVATTIIEVGIDVPNASLMVVENAERLGLAQLHQLRGRVGRGGQYSVCVLVYRPPLSYLGRERLAVMRKTSDGFEIAHRDLELRGPGEVLGTRQSGVLQFKIADLVRDQALLSQVARTADLLLHTYPERVVPLVRRWLGQSAQFGDV